MGRSARNESAMDAKNRPASAQGQARRRSLCETIWTHMGFMRGTSSQGILATS